MKRGAPMKRTAPLRSRPKAAPARERVVVLPPRTAARAAVMVAVSAEPAAPVLKTPDRKSQAIRDSASGEDCLIRLPGCPSDRAMTIWSHNRRARAGKGGQVKAIDLNGCYGCTWCDAVYDGQAPRPAGLTLEQVELAWYHAHAESLVKLKQKGLA